MTGENYNLIRALNNNENFILAEHLQDFNQIEDLASKMNIEESRLTRSLKILETTGIIQKQDAGFFLTDLGNRVLKKSHGIEFVISNSSYFENHSIEEIPAFLIQQIDAFSDSEIVETIWPITKKIMDLSKTAQEFVFCIFTEPPFLLAEPLYENIQSGIKLRLLFGRNSILPDCNDLVDRLELNKPKSHSLFEKQICDKITTNLVVSDKGGCLMLGDKNSRFDMTFAISGTDIEFIRWCEKFFGFKWNQGQPFARLRTDNNSE